MLSTVMNIKKYLIPILVFLVGVILSIQLFMIGISWEREKMSISLKNESERRAEAFQSIVNNNSLALESLASFYKASIKVEKGEFSLYTSHLLNSYNSIGALEWIPRVTYPERKRFEELAREYYANFSITERLENGSMVPAARRDEYYPVYYVEPVRGNEAAIGFDLASNPTRLKALQRAIETGKAIATSRIKLVQGEDEIYGILMAIAVYKKNMPLDTIENKHSAAMGFVLGGYNIADLFEEGLKHLSLKGLDIYLYDDSSMPDEQFLYRHVSGTTSDRADNDVPRGSLPLDGPYYKQTINVADKEWSMYFIPNDIFIGSFDTMQRWVILISMLILSSLLALVAWFVKADELKARKHSQEMMKTNEMLEQGIDEKELLLREVHHRVKNNLTIISSFLNLQSYQTDDKMAIEMLSESKNRVHSMALVHENLYQNDNLTSIDFAEYTGKLIGDLMRSHGSRCRDVRVTTDIDDISLSLDTLIPCGLIMNELINNSFKYAVGDTPDPEIRIMLKGKDNKVTLTVGDNGPGLPEDEDLKASKSLGLKIVASLVKQLKGQVEIDRTRGTEFNISFSFPENKVSDMDNSQP